jgi:hypothetical protein
MVDILDAIPEATSGCFFDVLREWQAAKSIGTDDLIPAVLPLFEQVRRQHEQGNVAPLNGIDKLKLHDGRELWFNAAEGWTARFITDAIRRIEQTQSTGIDVTGEIDVYEANDQRLVGNRSIAQRGQVADRPLYHLDYTSWEMVAGHHDALSDIFALGMILGSLATRFDFTKREDLQQFLLVRRNIHASNPRIHPVVSRLVAHMTELRREDRAQDLSAIIDTLDDYRRAETDDFEDKLKSLADIADPTARRSRTQEYLRNRLYEISRRNRLVYFKETAASRNLTIASLPFTLNYRAIRADRLLVANETFCKALAKLYEAKDSAAWLPLKQRLRFEDYPFLAPSLDKIRLQAQADTKEYGFSQLRLVVAFLRWHNLVRDRTERIHSPLILLPVELKKQRGTEDGFMLSPLVSVREAEVNPVLRHHLHDVYGIDLPESVDLTNFANLTALHDKLERAVRRREAGVTIHRIDKPRIQLIHKTVKRQIDDFRSRHRRTGRGLKDYGGLGYSYDADNFAPLGLALFNQYVRVQPAPGREMIANGGSPDDPVTNNAPETERELSRDFYAVESGQGGDPLNWELDLTAITLTNFNYRKMSLVRDYAELCAGRTTSHVNFDRLFSSDVKSVLSETAMPGYLERHLILPTDPSQEAAVLHARTGESYVIQGPPGTGKSQTIANLLADFAARGRKVLFVCEKRIALDVVFHRLAEAGLEDLTCLVHDTKEDKRAFIAELKRIYEAWREQKTSPTVVARRQKLIGEIEALISELETFSRGMTANAQGADIPLRALVELAAARGIAKPWLNGAEREELPTWSDLSAARDKLADLERRAAGRLKDGLTPQALLRFVRSELAQRERLLAFLTEAVPAARGALDAIDPVLRLCVLPPDQQALEFGQLLHQCRLASVLGPLAQNHKLHLLDQYHPEQVRFIDVYERISRRKAELESQRQANCAWTDRLSPQDTEIALRIARQREGRFLSFLYSDWRRLKRRIAASHQGEVLSYVTTLERLAAEHAAQATYDADIKAAQISFGIEDLAGLKMAIDLAAGCSGIAATSESALIQHCLADPNAAARSIIGLTAQRQRLERATPLALKAHPNQLQQHAELLGDILPGLAELDAQAPHVTQAWRQLQLDVDDLEKATLIEAIERTFRRCPEIERFDTSRLKFVAERLAKALDELRDLNAKHAIEACRGHFRNSIAMAQTISRGSTDSAPHNAYRVGCKTLEHQFGLTRPSKSLRQLLNGESGTVLRDLKPIWMMSPLSVADTLPFADDLFDAVIFDEASQIPLEDAVPSLYRARQTIIVGDEMQLPPTSFFAAGSESEEPLPDYIAYAVSADSLLAKAATALAATKLTWHYRSRHESLISFCNRAFYAGELNTVPSRKPLKPAPEILITELSRAKRDQSKLINHVLDRPVSSHRIDKGVFRNQRNEAEAEYVAELVCALLKKNTGKSIGVVAFSQPQAQAIETAIDAIALDDKRFGDLLEDERDRYDKGQFVGLLVKNLESVQGDERDIIIVSVGYAPGSDGKMRMNFGPINQSGGEKRLNVIFSRAKQHIAIVTSIRYQQITNDYNVGANTLKQYLRYAAAVSMGHEDEMHACLNGLGDINSTSQLTTVEENAVVSRIAEQLAAQGMTVSRCVGHSTLRADIAVKTPGEDEYQRAILVDTEAHYAVPNVVERYVTRPQLFRAFGWQVEQVLGKDWLRQDRSKRLWEASLSCAKLRCR